MIGQIRPDVYAKQEKFLACYTKVASLSEAARITKISLNSHYNWLYDDKSYPARFAVAEKRAVESLEAEAFRRAMRGSDRLMEFILRAKKRDVYGDKSVVEVTADVKQVSVGISLDAKQLGEEEVRVLLGLLATGKAPAPQLEEKKVVPVEPVVPVAQKKDLDSFLDGD